MSVVFLSRERKPVRRAGSSLVTADRGTAGVLVQGKLAL